MVRDTYDRLCAELDIASRVPQSELQERGFSQYTIAAAVQDKLLRVVGVEKTGLPGRPRRLLQLTAKGQRAAQRHRDHLVELARMEDDGGPSA